MSSAFYELEEKVVRQPVAPATRAVEQVDVKRPGQSDAAQLVAIYANFCRIAGTPEELILDFGFNPQPFGIPMEPIVVERRVVTTFHTAKRLLQALELMVQRQEQVFGALETDVQKRLALAAGGHEIRSGGSSDLLRPEQEPAVSEHPGFLPSEGVAQLIVRDALARENELPPDEKKADLIEGRDLIWVAPSGPPRTADWDELVLKTRESVGVRMGRLIATLAFRAAAEGQESLRIADSDRFRPSFLKELRKDVPVGSNAEDEIYSRLCVELRTQAQRGAVAGAWGRAEADRDGLRLKLRPMEVSREERRRASLL